MDVEKVKSDFPFLSFFLFALVIPFLESLVIIFVYSGFECMISSSFLTFSDGISSPYRYIVPISLAMNVVLSVVCILLHDCNDTYVYRNSQACLSLQWMFDLCLKSYACTRRGSSGVPIDARIFLLSVYLHGDRFSCTYSNIVYLVVSSPLFKSCSPPTLREGKVSFHGAGPYLSIYIDMPVSMPYTCIYIYRGTGIYVTLISVPIYIQIAMGTDCDSIMVVCSPDFCDTFAFLVCRQEIFFSLFIFQMHFLLLSYEDDESAASASSRPGAFLTPC